MGLKRRDFLRRVGWILASLGISEAGWLPWRDRDYQALAQPSPRKLALLVGINQYPQQPLIGCLTDVELQRELLIHRFGFTGSNILTLTDQQATRQQIETAFLEHLTKQAQPGDAIVFHFSGYGRRVQLSTSPEQALGLIPVDGMVSTSDGVAVNDLLEESLRLLLRSLSTDRVTTILDTSFIAPSTARPEALRIRSQPQLVQGQLSAEVLAFQEQLQRQLTTEIGIKASSPSAHNGIPTFALSPMPGVVLTASGSTEPAIEGQWPGFSAGLFTYALTQYLWEATPATTVQVSLRRVSGVVEQLGGRQQPTLSGQRSQDPSLLTYQLLPEYSVGADGVVVAVEDDGRVGQLWLAGLPPTVLEYYGAGAKLSLIPSTLSSSDEQSPLHVQIRSRAGLTAKVQLAANDGTGSLQVGQLVQETVRVLPRNISLTVALEASLRRIERVDATSAFTTIPYVSLVGTGEPSTDYLFGRVREANPSSSLSQSSYGLFSLSQALIPNTAGEAGEAVKIAVQRLVPKMQTLLAAKLWRLTANEGSSRLGVEAKLLVMSAQEQVLMQRETLRSPKTATFQDRPFAYAGNIPTLPIGSRIQYQVYNNSDRPVYLIVLGLDTSKNAIALYFREPAQESNPSDKLALRDLVINPGQTLTVPCPAAVGEWVIHGPTGSAETQLIFSSAPFTQTRTVLNATTYPQGELEGIGTLSNSVEVAQAVLQDLHSASTQQVETGSLATDAYMLSVNDWASLNFIYEVV